MNEMKKLNLRYETVAWGLVLILIAGFDLIPGNQGPEALLGIGIILLGLNLVRYLSKIPISAFSTTLGILSFGLGTITALKLVHIEIPAFSLILFVIGLYLLVPHTKIQSNS